jgi:hypothetical protein
MKKLGAFCLLASMILFQFSCTQDIIDTDDGIDELTSETLTSAESRSGNSSTVVIYEDPDGPPETLVEVPGASSKLTRNANGITMNFKTKNLIPGNAYTVWFVIFGDDPGPPVLVTYAAGHVVGGSGNGNFSGHLSVGDIFNNPLTAEVHLALRSHGPVQPEMMPEQIQTIDGGCQLPDIGYPSGPALYPDADIVGYCANVHVAMHPAVE